MALRIAHANHARQPNVRLDIIQHLVRFLNTLLLRDMLRVRGLIVQKDANARRWVRATILPKGPPVEPSVQAAIQVPTAQHHLR